jgi:hypothetical protein
MRVYRTVVNGNDVIHYIIKDGKVFFSELDLAAKARIYGRTDTDNVVIPVEGAWGFISMDRVEKKYPDRLNPTSYRSEEVWAVAALARRDHNRKVISFSVADDLIEIIE